MTAKEFIKSKQNGVLLNDYTLQEMEWFMTEFAKQKQNNMKAKDKAKELVDKFLNVDDNDPNCFNAYMSYFIAKQCALICVDEMIKFAYDVEWEKKEEAVAKIKFLKEVEQEIKKL